MQEARERHADPSNSGSERLYLPRRDEVPDEHAGYSSKESGSGMGNRKPTSSKVRRATAAPARRPATRTRPSSAPTPSASDLAPDEPISYSALSLHDLFEQQARQMLDRTDLDEEQKQNILVAMSCPCCGAGALSFTAKLKR